MYGPYKSEEESIKAFKMCRQKINWVVTNDEVLQRVNEKKN